MMDFRAFEAARRGFFAFAVLAIFSSSAFAAAECFDARAGLAILGMAKSSLDVKGGKGRSIELDFLRLAYSAQKLRAGGVDAAAYLLVMNDAVALRARGWAKKYDAEGAVEVLVADLPPDQQARLRAEKKENAAGIRSASGETKIKSRAKKGEIFGEKELRRQIIARHPAAIESEIGDCRPFDIRWDFVGHSPE